MDRQVLREIRKKQNLCIDCGSLDVCHGKTAKLCESCHQKRKRNHQEWFAREGQKRQSDFRKQMRVRALQKICNQAIPKCLECGCDILELLEINHINGHGQKDYINHTGQIRTYAFYRKIVKGERKTDDLNVLCKVCNWKHQVELRFGKQHWTIKWH